MTSQEQVQDREGVVGNRVGKRLEDEKVGTELRLIAVRSDYAHLSMPPKTDGYEFHDNHTLIGDVNYHVRLEARDISIIGGQVIRRVLRNFKGNLSLNNTDRKDRGRNPIKYTEQTVIL